MASKDDTLRSPRQWQFSLRAALLCVLGLSMIFAIASQFPRQSGFMFLMTVLMLLPLMVVGAVGVLFVRIGIIPCDGVQWGTRDAQGSNAGILQRLPRFLGIWQLDNNPSLGASFATTLISTVTLIGLWPALREIGLMMSLASIQSISETWQYALRSVPDAFSRGSYWLRLWQWELWSLGRWWLLFGVILVAWHVVSLPVTRGQYVDRTSRALARFLAFTPWFIVLEIAFLIGVWIESPNTVPEPSTGFVVGIFSWDLWHWDCWLDRGWLIRGALPTFIAGVVFFVSVLRWWWVASVIAALVLVPVALLLSVACTVAYQNGLPPLL